MRIPHRIDSIAVLVVLLAALAATGAAQSADTAALNGASTAQSAADTLILVARPQLPDAIYGASVIVARSLQDGTYIGFMLNKPTTMTLGKLFPKDRTATDVADPVFLVGPESMNVIFALVARHDTPGAGSIEIAPDLFLAINGEVVDRIIASEAGHALLRRCRHLAAKRIERRAETWSLVRNGARRRPGAQEADRRDVGRTGGSAGDRQERDLSPAAACTTYEAGADMNA